MTSVYCVGEVLFEKYATHISTAHLTKPQANSGIFC